MTVNYEDDVLTDIKQCPFTKPVIIPVLHVLTTCSSYRHKQLFLIEDYTGERGRGYRKDAFPSS